jgi:flagellar operon protein
MSSPFLYPNVTQVPQSAPGGEARPARGQEGKPGEFDQVLDRASVVPLQRPAVTPSAMPGVVKEPLKFSAHATQRLRDRNIRLDPQTLGRISDAIDKADSKGVQDTLVLTGEAALIVSVKNRTVITAMDRGALTGNVFTNIDGAVIV